MIVSGRWENNNNDNKIFSSLTETGGKKALFTEFIGFVLQKEKAKKSWQKKATDRTKAMFVGRIWTKKAAVVMVALWILVAFQKLTEGFLLCDVDSRGNFTYVCCHEDFSVVVVISQHRGGGGPEGNVLLRRFAVQNVIKCTKWRASEWNFLSWPVRDVPRFLRLAKTSPLAVTMSLEYAMHKKAHVQQRCRVSKGKNTPPLSREGEGNYFTWRNDEALRGMREGHWKVLPCPGKGLGNPQRKSRLLVGNRVGWAPLSPHLPGPLLFLWKPVICDLYWLCEPAFRQDTSCAPFGDFLQPTARNERHSPFRLSTVFFSFLRCPSIFVLLLVQKKVDRSYEKSNEFQNIQCRHPLQL